MYFSLEIKFNLVCVCVCVRVCVMHAYVTAGIILSEWTKHYKRISNKEFKFLQVTGWRIQWMLQKPRIFQADSAWILCHSAHHWRCGKTLLRLPASKWLTAEFSCITFSWAHLTLFWKSLVVILVTRWGAELANWPQITPQSSGETVKITSTSTWR